MARRGAKPKPSALRLIDGTRNVTRHGSESAVREKIDRSSKSFGALTKPSKFSATAAAAWRRYIAPAAWLDASREPAAIAFCELWSEFQSDPSSFPAAKHGQMRAYMSELGLTDERNRAEDEGRPSDEFFDD